MHHGHHAAAAAAASAPAAPPPPPYSHYPGYHHGPQYRDPSLAAFSAGKRPLRMEDQSSKRPRKKGPNQKWDADEDARIIELRGSGMKWADISKHLPGRSDIGCRLHYQNYLEKRGEWDEEKKSKLARVYERLKADLWQPIATELNVPWRAAEAMHWILGEREIARRANTVPFSIVSGANTAGPQGEGNGRIAQSTRMHESTIYFEANEVNAALNGPPGTNGGIGVHEQGVSVRGSGAGTVHRPSYQTYEADEDGSSEGSRPSVGGMMARQVPRDDSMRLPSLTATDDNLSAVTGRGSLGGCEKPPERKAKGSEDGGPSQTPSLHEDHHLNRPPPADHAVDHHAPNHAPSVHAHHHRAQDREGSASQVSPRDGRRSSKGKGHHGSRRSSRCGSDASRDSSSSSSVSGGYVQVTREGSY
ncbi:MAG: hypothetical protein Q9163_006389 [Psora crenata]